MIKKNLKVYLLKSEYKVPCSEELTLFWELNGLLEIDLENNHTIILKVIDSQQLDITTKMFARIQNHFNMELSWLKLMPGESCNIFDIVISTASVISAKAGSIGEQPAMILKLDRIGYSFVDTNEDKLNSEFFINSNFSSQISKNYKHNPVTFPWTKEEFSFKPEHKYSDGFKCGTITYKPEFDFSLKENSSEKTLIYKRPKITVTSEEADWKEIKLTVDIICKLYSFYCHDIVSYNHAVIYSKGIRRIEISEIIKTNKESENGIFGFDVRQNPDNIVLNVDYIKLFKNIELISNLISKYNIAINSDGESRFMLLYNVLEQLRSHAGIKYREKFEFKDSKKVNHLIRNCLNEVANMIKDDDGNEVENFKSTIEDKLSQFKFKSMSNQFETYFVKENLSPGSYNLDFKRLVKLRNDFFHGGLLDENAVKELNDVNNYKHFPRFVGTALMRFMGITDLTKMKFLPSGY